MKTDELHFLETESNPLSRRGFLACLVAGSAVALYPATASALELGDGEDSSGDDFVIDDGDELGPYSETFLVDDEGAETLITVVEDGDIYTVIAVDQQTDEVNRVVYDEGSGMLSSTYTGKIFGIDFLSMDEGNGIQRMPQTSYYYMNVSYADIKKIAGAALTVASLAVAVATAGRATLAVKIAQNILKAAKAGVKVSKPSTSHGLRLRIKRIKHFRRGNKIPYRTERSIVGITTY